jgi:hypothetical protein
MFYTKLAKLAVPVRVHPSAIIIGEQSSKTGISRQRIEIFSLNVFLFF